MNSAVTQSFGDRNTNQVSGVDTPDGYGMVGITVQIVMMYIITRDLLMTSSFLNYYIPLSGTVQARLGVALLIAWIAWSSRGFGPGFGAFRSWGWVILGSFALMFLVEGMLTITAGTNAKRIVVEGVNIVIFLFIVSIAYLFALRGRTPIQALRFLVQPYVYLSVIVSLLGLTAWALVHTGLVDPADWYLPDQFAVGRLSSTELSGYYSSPFYISGILNESSGFLLGFNFNRASSLFEEPSIAAFFVTPAIFLMPLVFITRSSRRKLLLGILAIFAFLLVASSTTNIVLMVILALLILFKLMVTHPRIKQRILATLGIIIVGLLAGLMFLQVGGIATEIRVIGSSYADGLRQSLEIGSWLGPGILQGMATDDPRGVTPRGLLSWIVVLFHILILAGLGIRMILSRNSRWYIGGALLYVAGHSMKSFGHTATSGYYVYMLMILALALACYWGSSRTETKIASQESGIRQPVYLRHTPGTGLPG